MYTNKHVKHVLPIHVINPRTDSEKSVHIGEELESLIKTMGGDIVERVIQKRSVPDQATYIGQGKLQEICYLVEDLDIDIVVLNAMAKPRQIHAIKTRLEKINPEIEVWDRVDLILQIFDKHAATTEAKLQIELARMRYMGPRIYGMGMVMSRQGGGIGTVGVGETNTELMKRHWRDEMKSVMNELEKLRQNRERQLERRKRAGYKTVSIVGYTNAGKSSLYNLLTKKGKLVKDALFATLDSSLGKVYLAGLDEEILLSDTIGFIRDLPPNLIDAFKSTLMESVHADVLLHVIDVSDEEMDEKIRVVEKILHDVGVSNKTPVIYVFNKLDKAPNIDKAHIEEQYAEHNPHFISVADQLGIETLQDSISKQLVQIAQTSQEHSETE